MAPSGAALRLVALALALLMMPGKPMAATPQELLTRVFTAPGLEAGWFTPDMLAAVPLAELRALRDRLVAEAGPFASVEPRGQAWQARFARATVAVRLALDGEGRIAGLWLGPPLPLGDSLEAVAAELAALPGKVSFLVRRDGEVLAAANPALALSAGSAFKLAVLLALEQEIAAGRAGWDEVLRLRERQRSLPTGELQDWPAGAPLTLYSLAALMIARSDNTATDMLIDRLGRARIEALLPPEAAPLLTTRELFLLGGRAHAGERAAFLAGDAATRRALLAALGGVAPSLDDYRAGGAGPELGYRLSVETLCGLMERLLGSALLAINPGPADPAGWAGVGYKGGSQPGVLNMTTGLIDAAGRRFCVAVTWNQPGLDQGRLEALYARLLAALSAAR